LKSGGLYQFLYSGTSTDDLSKKFAVYRSSPTHPDPLNRNRIWVRSLSEFFDDNRFKHLFGAQEVDELALDKTYRRPVLFVTGGRDEAFIVSSHANIPKIENTLMLQDIKGLGGTAIMSIHLMTGYTGLPVLPENVLILFLDSALQEIFIEERKTLRAAVIRLKPASVER
jgi:hypothetical protein